MASYLVPDDDLEADGSTDLDQTSSVPSDGGATTLDLLKSEQARLLQQVLDSPEGLTEGSDIPTPDVIPKPNGTTASNALSEQQRAANREMTLSEMTISPATISMPGLQPFAKGKKSLPCNWSDCTLSIDVPFCLVMLNKQSWEFQSILAEFTEAGLTVKKIERIENRDLWEKFEFERKRMEKNRTEVNEVYLFHGTLADKEQICLEGLDQRLSRIGFFGRGIYFSNDPRKCVSYTESDQTNVLQTTCTVYKCRVLLGNMKVYPPGQHAKGLKREPLVENPEPGGPKYYDSVQGHVKEFDEFILYKSERVMPEYVISCYLPLASSIQDLPTQQTVEPSTNHKDVTAEEDLYGGLTEDEQHTELKAESLRQPLRNVGLKNESLEQELYGGLDEEEISAELAAEDLRKPTNGSQERESKEDDDDENGMKLKARGLKKTLRSVSQKTESIVELKAGGLCGPQSEGESEEDGHPELEEERDVYEQLHQDEIFAAIKESGRREQELVRRSMDAERRQEPRRAEESDDRLREESPDVVVNQLDDEDDLEESRAGSGSELTGGHQRRLKEVRSKMKSCQPKSIPKKPSLLHKSASEPTIASRGIRKPDVTVNTLEEPRRHRKEVIAAEFLPVVLEVREKVQKARLTEKEMESKVEAKRTLNAPSVEHKTRQWVQEEVASAWTPKEYAKQQELIAKVREKVRADRKAEELEKYRQKKLKDEGQGAGEAVVTDNLLSVDWREDGNDGVGEVLDVLIVQFMDVTACEDIVEARECVLQANMDVNKAIISYING